MKVLYVGTLGPECSTCFSRFSALQKLELDVHGFDTDPYFKWEQSLIGRLHQMVETHLLFGMHHEKANFDLILKCRELRPNIVWIDTGVWIKSSTLRLLKQMGCFLVMHITDALKALNWRVRYKRRQLNSTLPLYNVLLTTNINDYKTLAGSLAPTCFLTDLGYDNDLFTSAPMPTELAKKWDNDIVFIGHYEKSTEAGILALIDAGLSVTVFGHNTWFSSPNRARLGERLKPFLSNQDYVSAIKGASIGLCFVSALNYNQTAGRSFEIPGSGTFLLAPRTKQHLNYYLEGVEAEFFSDLVELVGKAKYYLKHPTEREDIAMQGYKRCLKSGYSWYSIMARDWPKVLQVYANYKLVDVDNYD